MKQTYFHKYQSVDVPDIDKHDSSVLSPVSKLVSKQWKKDEHDDLLINGYYKTCNISHELPSDVSNIIIRYYLKKYSKGEIKRKIAQLKEYAAQKRQQRKENICECFYGCAQCSLVIFVVILCLAFVFGSDIAAIVIVISNNDCDAGSSSYLLIGSITHIVLLLGVFCCMMADKTLNFILSILSIVALLMTSWSVVGTVIYSEMDQSTQCSNMVLSWVILKFLMYAFFFVLFIWSTESITLGKFAVISMWAVSWCSDIAGLAIVNVIDCSNQQGKSIFFDLSITEHLSLGCISHMIAMIILPIVAIPVLIHDSGGKAFRTFVCVFICSGLFYFAWSIVGLILYSEINVSDSFNRKCSDMLLAWSILKLIECIALKPFWLWGTIQN